MSGYPPLPRHLLRAAVAAVCCALFPAQLAAQEEAPAAPPLAIESITVEPSAPGPDTLCRLRVKLSNGGEQIASQLGFQVTLNGQSLVVYDNQLFMYPVPAGGSLEIPLYNFWTTETSRPMPASGKLEVVVTLKEAIWTKVEMEEDEQGEIEVWTPLGPVPGLPVSASLTVPLKAAS